MEFRAGYVGDVNGWYHSQRWDFYLAWFLPSGGSQSGCVGKRFMEAFLYQHNISPRINAKCVDNINPDVIFIYDNGCGGGVPAGLE